MISAKQGNELATREHFQLEDYLWSVKAPPIYENSFFNAESIPAPACQLIRSQCFICFWGDSCYFCSPWLISFGHAEGDASLKKSPTEF